MTGQRGEDCDYDSEDYKPGSCGVKWTTFVDDDEGRTTTAHECCRSQFHPGLCLCSCRKKHRNQDPERERLRLRHLLAEQQEQP